MEAPGKGKSEADPTHSALHGLLPRAALAPFGVEVTVSYPRGPGQPYPRIEDFLIRHPR